MDLGPLFYGGQGGRSSGIWVLGCWGLPSALSKAWRRPSVCQSRCLAGRLCRLSHSLVWMLSFYGCYSYVLGNTFGHSTLPHVEMVCSTTYRNFLALVVK